jgi:hypothetical protein
MSNSKTDYNTFVRANLPYYITYDSVRNQYVTINGKRFVTYKEAKWYMDYIIKFGYPLNPLGGYAANGFIPELGYDFVNEVYVVNSAPTTVNFERSGAATMVDSDGVLKWSPHNLAINSTTPATQSITVVSGVDYTVECTGAGSITLSGAGTGSVTAGSPVEVTASTATLTLTVVGSLDTMWAYRSDLGGMVDNPDTDNSYVPTDATAVFLPRRNAHVYNGTTWVNEGLLHEEAGTNLLPDSNDFTAASWFKSNTGTLLKDAIGPDGELSATTLIDSNAGGTGFVFVRESVTVTPASLYTVSVFAKADQLSDMLIYLINFTTPPNSGVYFDLSAGTAQVSGAATFVDKQIVDCGNGWYRCSITFETDAADTAGDVISTPSTRAKVGRKWTEMAHRLS